MFELAGGIALGVDIGDLLELQGSLEGNREINPSADEKEISAVIKRFDQGAYLLLNDGKNLLDDPGTVNQMLTKFFSFIYGDAVSHLGKIEGKEKQCRQLGNKGLGRGHTYFRTGVGVDGAVGLAGHGGADHVADGQYSGAHFCGPADTGQGIGGFTRLRN